MEDVSDDDFVDDVDGDDMANNMLMAAKDDDLATLRALIARGGDVNWTYSLNADMSLLKYGISRDASEVVELLLQSGATATLETRDNDGWRPLHIACVNKSLRCAPILGAFGADLNAKTNRGITGLHILAAHRDMERAALVVAAFLKAGARPDEETSAGKTPLCFALQRNNHDLVKILLRAGASAEIANIHDHPLRHLLDGVRAAGDWKQWCSKHRGVLSGLVAKLAPRPGKPGAQRAGRARRAAVARPFPLDAASHIVSFWVPEGGS